jgi:hypothetical protein
MMPHPEMRRILTAQHVESLRGAAASPSGSGARRRLGLWLIAAGTRLAADAAATRRPRRVAA